MSNPEPDELHRLRRIEELAREREHAEEVWADAETAYNESTNPTLTRTFLQLDRLETERAEAVHALRAALDGPTPLLCRRRAGDPDAVCPGPRRTAPFADAQ